MTKKRKWKLKQKWTGLIISVICFVSVIAYAVADATPTLKVSVTNPVIAAQNGQDAIIDRSESGSKKTVTYHLDFENDKEFNSLSFFINYDPTKLKLISYNPTAKNPSPSENVMDEGNGLLVWSIMYMGAPTNTSLDIGDITFEVLETASGKTDITLTNIEANKITDGGQTLTPVTVNGVNESVFIRVPVIESSINLTTPTLEIDLGSSNKNDNIVVDYSPKDTTDDKNFTYQITEGLDVVKVENGVVTGLKIGTAKIKVTAFQKEFEVVVNVKEHLRGVNISNNEITNNTLEINKNTLSGPITLTTKTTPSTTSDTINYTWTSSNTSVATVNNNGVVSILKNGTTTISVTATSNETSEKFTDSVVLNVTSPATSVSINETDFTIDKNTTKTLTGVVTPSDTTDTLKWTSSNTSVATVDQFGKVTAIDGGEATITLTVGNHSDSVKVNVNVPVTDISIDITDTITLLPNQTQKVIASVIPANANDKTITWSVLDNTIATVDNTGLITAKNAGETTLTIQSGSITKTRKIKVLKEVEGLNINIPNQTLKKGETIDLIATPTTGAEETGVITWTSSNPSVATVENGKVTAISPNDGSASTAIITATWTSNMNPQHKETVTSTITVIDPITKIELNKDSLTLEGKGKEEKLEVKLTPNITSSDKTITWTSSDNSVATITNNGVVKSIGKGSATITATTSNGLTASLNVTVTIPTTSVTINSQKEITMNINTTNNLTAKVEPSDNSDTLNWSSSDNNIVSVNNLGMITAKNAGTAIITAKSGSKEDKITVKVVIPVTSFHLVSKDNIKVLKGTTSTIVTKINPENATDQTITWTSNNESVATVNDSGIVTAKNAGFSVITGSLSNGMKVTVTVEVEIIPITDMEFATDKLEIKRKEEKQLEVLVTPENTTEKDQIKWTSSDEEIAIVNEFGIVTGKKEGTVTITATYKDIEKSVEVNVTEVHLESISLENPVNELNVGDTTKLNVTLNPTDVTDDLIYTYSSSDESIATIDESGIITGINPGKVTFTIEVNGMKLTHEMTIRKIKNPQTGISSVASYGIISILSLVGIGYLYYKKSKMKI